MDARTVVYDDGTSYNTLSHNSITVTNTGNLTLTGISFTDTLKNGDGTVLSLNGPITFISSSQGSVSGTLLFTEAASYTASYTITQSDVDSGLVSNSLFVVASSPGQTNTGRHLLEGP